MFEVQHQPTNLRTPLVGLADSFQLTGDGEYLSDKGEGCDKVLPSNFQESVQLEFQLA